MAKARRSGGSKEVVLRLLLVGAVVLGTLATSFAQDVGQFRIEILGPIDVADFPKVRVAFRVVDATGKLVEKLPAEDIVILEDGAEVHRIPARELRAVPSRVMLTIDTSGSMERQGKMAEAKAAAAKFVTGLNPNTSCGLVLFHHETHLRLSPRLEREALLGAITRSKPLGGTAYLDAALESMEQFGEEGREERRAIVLMTDGRDVNSKANFDQVVSAARQAHTPIYTVGLGEPGRNQPVRSVLVLDRSGSMAGQKMRSLHLAAARFVTLMPAEMADTTIVAFNDRIQPALPFGVDKENLIRTIQDLHATGATRLFDAIYEGLETLHAGRGTARPDTRSVIIALTDGKDGEAGIASVRRVDEVAARAKQLGVRIFMLGLGPDYDIDEPPMRLLADATGGRYLHIRDAARLTEVFEELSISLHDDGIDELSLRRLAAQTGGEYHHVRAADQLSRIFVEVAQKVENTLSATFTSRRARADGTSRGIEVRLGQLATTADSYTVHGLIVPASDRGLYLAGLVVLLTLLAVPGWFRRKSAA